MVYIHLNCPKIKAFFFIWPLGYDDFFLFPCVGFHCVHTVPKLLTHLSQSPRNQASKHSITELVSWMQKTTRNSESMKCRSFLLPSTWQEQQAGHPWVCPKIKYNSENRSETKIPLPSFHERWSTEREEDGERERERTTLINLVHGLEMPQRWAAKHASKLGQC